MDAPSDRRAALTLPSDTEILVVRTLPAPKHLVFEAWSRPDYVTQWYSCRDFVMTIHAMDFREGGRWRWALRNPADGAEYAFSGEYHEILRPDRLVFTEREEARPDSSRVVTLSFTEPRQGCTTLSMHLAYATKRDRDSHLRAGVERGMALTMERLEQLLASMRGAIA